MAKPTSMPEPMLEPRRQTVPIWMTLLGALAFVAGCYLLFLEDGNQIRRAVPDVRPRSALPSARQFSEISPIVPSAPATPSSSTNTARVIPAPSATGALAGVAAASGRGASAPTSQSAPAGAAATAFPADFLASLWRDADAAGIRRSTFDRAMALARTPDPDVIALSASQPEFDRTAGDYITSIVTPDRVAFGRARIEQQPNLLAELERRYGVDRTVLLAIWGIESNYGAAKGDRNVIRSLATLANGDPRRAASWRSELLAALTIADHDRIAPEALVGSWAGAMGHTQLMPSSYLKAAVDFDGTGSRDVWHSIPNALASTAHYLQTAGWQSGQTWGREVVLPADFDYSFASSSAQRSMSAWRILGVRAQTGTLPVDDAASWQLIVPAGAGGPAFLVAQNFNAILNYNPSTSYALAVGILADKIAGKNPVQAAWPASDVAMTRDQRVELQEILASLGFDPGAIDGIIGVKTRDAIRKYQSVHAMPADAHPSLVLLNRLRSDRRL